LEDRSLPSSFQQFEIRDASDDFTEQTAFQGGALRATYEIDGVLPSDTVQVTVDAWQSGVKIAVMQAFTTAHLAFGLVPVGGDSWSLPEGTYDMRAAAVINGAPEILSAPVTIQVLGGSVVQGDFRGETFDFAAMSGDGVVVHGAGGTDTLRLPVSFASLT